MKEDLKTMHERGMPFLETRRDKLPDVRQQTTEWSELATLGRDKQAKDLRDQLAAQLAMEKRIYLRTVRFAAAVETIVANCVADTRELLLEGKYRQTAKGILALSRTSDTRQRYRVGGVRDGRFRSVAPQNDDAVFDTVSFSEVPSRLGRSRGTLRQLHAKLNTAPTAVRDESHRLSSLCRQAAQVLGKLVGGGLQTPRTIPDNLRKERVLTVIKSREVPGKITGLARQALRLTIKSVWDFPEMCERGITPTKLERQKTIQEASEIIAITEDIVGR